MAKRVKAFPVILNPAVMLLNDVLRTSGITYSALSRRIGVSRNIISQICRDRRLISADIAVRLHKFLGEKLCLKPSALLNMQSIYEVEYLEEKNKKEYKAIKPLKIFYSS